MQVPTIVKNKLANTLIVASLGSIALRFTYGVSRAFAKWFVKDIIEMAYEKGFQQGSEMQLIANNESLETAFDDGFRIGSKAQLTADDKALKELFPNGLPSSRKDKRKDKDRALIFSSIQGPPENFYQGAILEPVKRHYKNF